MRKVPEKSHFPICRQNISNHLIIPLTYGSYFLFLLDIVTLLLEYGSDVNDPGGAHCGGITPLHDSSQNGHLKVVKLLLAHNADVNAKCKEVWINRNTVEFFYFELNFQGIDIFVLFDTEKVRNKEKKLAWNALDFSRKNP